MKNLSLISLLSLILITGKAQVLLPESAIEIAIKNNLGILIANNNAEIASLSYSKGNAGMIPTIQLAANGNFSQNDTKQNLLNGTIVDRKGANSNGVNAIAQINWTLFDGMKMFFTYKKLRAEKDLNEKVLKQETETLICNLLKEYFTLVTTKQLINSSQKILDLKKARLEICESKWKNGISPKTIYLQALVDFNEQKIKLANLINEAEILKVTINEYMSRSPEIKFDVIDSIPISYAPSPEELKSSYKKNNLQLKIQETKVDINQNRIGEIKSQFFPKISFGSGLNFNRNENQAGFILLNRNVGYNAGINANWTLFNSGQNKRAYKQIKIEHQNAGILFKSIELGIEARILKLYLYLMNTKNNFDMEKENLSIAEENSRTALESFKSGGISSLELKDAEQSYESALQRIIQLRMDMKSVEIELLRANGNLLKP